VEHQADEVKPGEGTVTLTEGTVTLTLIVGGPPQIRESLELGTIRHPALKVHEPFHVSFTTEDDSARAHAEEIDEFGFGVSYTEALVDLQHAIAELYLTLEEEQERLGPDLARVWSVLQTKVRRRDVAPAA
jgi:hypothetical protein